MGPTLSLNRLSEGVDNCCARTCIEKVILGSDLHERLKVMERKLAGAVRTEPPCCRIVITAANRRLVRVPTGLSDLERMAVVDSACPGLVNFHRCVLWWFVFGVVVSACRNV